MSAEPCRPISFVDQLVRRILAGEKTQTRRLMNPQPRSRGNGWWEWGYKLGAPKATSPRSATWHGETWRREAGTAPLEDFCPIARVGERLWVRESYRFLKFADLGEPRRRRVLYLADGAEREVMLTAAELTKLRARKKRFDAPQPGRFLYKSCARLFLRVTSLRAERLQDITEEDAKAEGMEPAGVFWLGAPTPEGGRVLCETARGAFLSIWDSIYRNRPEAMVAANPWVWPVGFSIDQVLVRGEGRAA